jgi:hypothetical protein
MFSRLALLLLVCALVVPKVAWGAHLAGHEQMAANASVHTHHGNHAHEHAAEEADDQTSADEQATKGVGPDQGLTHDHSPSLSLAAATLSSDYLRLSSWFARAELRFDRSFESDALSRPESLLRPPRAA